MYRTPAEIPPPPQSPPTIMRKRRIFKKAKSCSYFLGIVGLASAFVGVISASYGMTSAIIDYTKDAPPRGTNQQEGTAARDPAPGFKVISMPENLKFDMGNHSDDWKCDRLPSISFAFIERVYCIDGADQRVTFKVERVEKGNP